MENVWKYFALLLPLSVVDSVVASAQTYTVRGAISVATTPVRYASVTFVDNDDTTNTFSALTDTSGKYQLNISVTSVKPDNSAPAGFELGQSYPNPFSSSTAISYKLNRQADVKVTVYDILGREIRTFRVGLQNAGTHGVVWDGRNDLGTTVSTGVYFYRLQARGETQVRKLVFGGGERSVSVSIPGFFVPQKSEREAGWSPDVQQKSFTVWVRNTDTTSPAVTAQDVGTVLIHGDATFNFTVSPRSDALVYPDSTRQMIRGFGGASIVEWIGDLTPNEAQLAFGNGEGELGMTILRIRVPSDSTKFHLEVPTAVMADSLGAIIMASPWSPPAAMKSNDTIVGGTLRPEAYASYAEYLDSFVDYMSAHGAPLYAISVQNEPDARVGYESCDWNAAQLFNFVKNNAPAIGTRVIAPESYKFDLALSDSILNDSAACANLSIVGEHIYGTGTLKNYPLALSKGKEIWMTEHIVECNDWPDGMEVAQEINDCMNASMSAYLLWYIRRFYGPIDEDGHANKGGYAMAQYSKFVRPGFHRVQATVDPPLSGMCMTAYKSGSRTVIVVLNKNRAIEQTFTIQNGTMGSFTPYVTSGSRNCQEWTTVSVANGSFTARLDPVSVTTLVSE